jgi:hypothetical protein
MSIENENEPEEWMNTLSKMGLPRIMLPDGRELSLSEWTMSTLRSAFIVHPYRDDFQWPCFSYGRSQPIVGDPEQLAQLVHTNIPRSGESGLPKDWEMYVTRWRASISEPLAQPILDFASRCEAVFSYNQKKFADAPLLDLLLAPQNIAGIEQPNLPVHLRESLSFEVIVSVDRATVTHLRDYLLSRTSPIGHTRDEWIYDQLAQIEHIAGGFTHEGTQAIASELRRLREKINPGRKLIGWIHLEGPLKRCVV